MSVIVLLGVEHNICVQQILYLHLICILAVSASGRDQFHIGNYNDDVGTLHSTNYPFDYDNVEETLYRIYLDPDRASESETSGVHVCLKFKRFRLEDSNDFVTFDYNGISHQFTANGRVRRNGAPRNAYPSVWVENFCWPARLPAFQFHFTSDDTVTFSGFFAEYHIYYTRLRTFTTPHDSDYTVFRCFNESKFIDIDMRCNGVKDCVDGSDETYVHAGCQSRRTTNELLGLNMKGCDMTGCDFGSDSRNFYEFELEPSQGWKSVDRSNHMYPTVYPPARDVSQESPAGHFLLASKFIRRDAEAYSILRQLEGMELFGSNTNISRYCMSFWYRMQGEDAGSLEFYLYRGEYMPTTKMAPIWSRKGSFGPVWRSAQVELEITQYMRTRLMILARGGSHFDGIIAIDQFYFKEGSCLLPRRDVSCNFEYGFCGWRLDQIDVNEQLTNNDYTLMNKDDYSVETSLPGYPSGQVLVVGKNKPAGLKLTSPPIHLYGESRTACLSLWYHTDGTLYDHTLRLEVYIIKASGEIMYSTPIFMKGGGQNLWSLGTASFSLLGNEPLQLQIEMDTLRNDGGLVIAIDEIIVIEGSCNEHSFTSCPAEDFQCANSNPAVCIPERLQCNGRADCPDGSDESFTISGCRYGGGGGGGGDYGNSHRCADGEFTCYQEYKCIPGRAQCDGESDCVDGRDELGCPLNPPEVTRVYAPAGLNPGAVGGIVVGILVIVSVIVAKVVLVLYKRRQARLTQEVMQASTPEPFTIVGDASPPPYSTHPPSYTPETYIANSQVAPYTEEATPTTSDGRDLPNEAPPSYDSVQINLSGDSTVFMRIDRDRSDIVIERSRGNTNDNNDIPPPRYSEIDQLSTSITGSGAGMGNPSPSVSTIHPRNSLLADSGQARVEPHDESVRSETTV